MRALKLLWAAPVTVLGALLAVAISVSGGRIERQGPAWEASGGLAPGLLWLMNPWMRIEAITLGHVILACDAGTANRMRRHEQVHVHQYETWGLLFPAAYLLSSGWAFLRGECPYRGNVFEREAFASEGSANSGQNVRRH